MRLSGALGQGSGGRTTIEVNCSGGREEVIIIGNVLSDGSPDFVRQDSPSVRLLPLRRIARPMNSSLQEELEVV
jgi:hypothetical protein